MPICLEAFQMARDGSCEEGGDAEKAMFKIKHEGMLRTKHFIVWTSRTEVMIA